MNRHFAIFRSFSRLHLDSQSLMGRVAVSAAWITGAHFLELFVRLGSSLIFTRLLFPEAFGIIAAAGTGITVLVMISDLGVRSVVVTSPNVGDEQFLRTAWTVQLVRSAILFLMALGLALAIATAQKNLLIGGDTAFGHSVVPKIIAVLGIVLLISGTESANEYVLVREIKSRG